MNCKRCGTRMEGGFARVPVWGNASRRIGIGATIYRVSAELGAVKKCPGCGHSVRFQSATKKEEQC